MLVNLIIFVHVCNCKCFQLTQQGIVLSRKIYSHYLSLPPYPPPQPLPKAHRGKSGLGTYFRSTVT